MGRLFDRTFAKQLFYLTTNDPLNPKLGLVSNDYFDPINPRLGLDQVRLVIIFANVHFPVS